MSASDAVEDRHGIGGNKPPAPLTPVEVTRFLVESEGALLKRRDDLLAGVVRFAAAHSVISDPDTQAKAGDFRKQIQAAIKQARDAFTVAKKPFLDGGRAVDSFFKGITDPLQGGLDDVSVPMLAYAAEVERIERARREQQARLAREEAQRVQADLVAEEGRRREAEAASRPRSDLPPPTIEEAISTAQYAAAADKAAGVKAADLTRTRGDLGSVSSLREMWDVEVEDLSQVPLQYLKFDYEAARRAVRQDRTVVIPGCRVFKTQHIMTR